MRTTGEFTVHQYRIRFKKYNEPIYLLPFGDIHKSSPMHHARKWQEFLQWARLKPRAYFLGMGDYDDLGSTSERKILRSDDLHDSTIKTLEDLYLKHTKAFAKDIEFMKPHLVGLLGGNHYGQFANGMTTDHKLCELMGTKYLGVNAFIRLIFEDGTRSMNLDIWAHHGRGSGRTVGSSMNPVVKQQETAEADIYLMGDNHQKDVSHKSRLRLTHNQTQPRLSHRKILFARTGSFLKGYEEGCQSYIVDAALPPSELGVVKIEITPRRDRTDGDDATYLDLHASV